MKKYLALPILIISMLISACSSVPTASKQAEQQAKNATAAQDKALIYVYQTEPFSSKSGFEVSLDGKIAGKLAANNFYLWTVEPGKYEMVSLTRNKAKLKLTVEAGQTYYINQKIDVGIWVSRSQLHKVSNKEGMKAVAACKLIVPK